MTLHQASLCWGFHTGQMLLSRMHSLPAIRPSTHRLAPRLAGGTKAHAVRNETREIDRKRLATPQQKALPNSTRRHRPPTTQHSNVNDSSRRMFHISSTPTSATSKLNAWKCNFIFCRNYTKYHRRKTLSFRNSTECSCPPACVAETQYFTR